MTTESTAPTARLPRKGDHVTANDGTTGVVHHRRGHFVEVTTGPGTSQIFYAGHLTIHTGQTPLTAGESTVADAARFHGVTVARIMRVLNDCLTDVYTPEGDGGVIAVPGRTYAVVTTRFGQRRAPAVGLALGSDSIAVLARYIPGER